MEPRSLKLSQRRNSKSKEMVFSLLSKFKSIEHIEVYDNDKFLILVGMDRDKLLNHVIKFDRFSLELD
jgi:hypothetical protein